MIYENTKQFKMENGKVKGVELFITDVPNQEYIVSHLRLKDEEEANGKTIAYCESAGRKDFYLAWPWRQGYTSFKNKVPTGGSQGEHVISNGYNPPDFGYLAIHLGKEPISQIVGGLGLPYNRHISFEIGFDKVDSVTPDKPTKPLPNSIVWPVGNITNYYADTSHTSKPHTGIDYAIAEGTPIQSILSGVVEWNDFDPGGYGWYIRIHNPELNLDIFYGHLAEKSLKDRGERVNAREVIGYVGNTGNSTGPHLHLEVRLRDTDGYNSSILGRGRTDPMFLKHVLSLNSKV